MLRLIHVFFNRLVTPKNHIRSMVVLTLFLSISTAAPEDSDSMRLSNSIAADDVIDTNVRTGSDSTIFTSDTAATTAAVIRASEDSSSVSLPTDSLQNDLLATESPDTLYHDNSRRSVNTEPNQADTTSTADPDTSTDTPDLQDSASIDNSEVSSAPSVNDSIYLHDDSTQLVENDSVESSQPVSISDSTEYSSMSDKSIPTKEDSSTVQLQADTLLPDEVHLQGEAYNNHMNDSSAIPAVVHAQDSSIGKTTDVPDAAKTDTLVDAHEELHSGRNDSIPMRTDSIFVNELTLTATDSTTKKRKEPPLLKIDSLEKRIFNQFGMQPLTLTLNEAIDYLLKYNPLVIAARLEWMANERKALAALGVLEPAITGSIGYNENYYSYRPLPEQNLEQSIGLRGRNIHGGEYSVEYSLTDMRHSRSSLDLPRAFTGVTVTQPLLRNAWNGSDLADRRIAIIERESAYHTYRSRLIQMIAELQNAYWNLDFSQEKYRFALQSVNIAEKVVSDAKMRYKAGKMSNADLFEAEAGLAARLANIADVRQELLDAANQLKLLLSTDDIGKDRLIFCTEDIFVDSSEQTTHTPSDSGNDFDISNHPEFMIRSLELDKEEVILKYRKSQCLPGLNAKGSFGISGYGSKASAAMFRLFNNPKPAWSAMLELELPVLGGFESRNLLAAQKLKKEATEKNLSAIKYQINNTMRIILQRVAAHCEHARNSANVVDLRQNLLDIEFRKLDAGKSTYRLIYETEEKLSEARQWQLESNVRYRMAIVLQAKVSGSMLTDFALETIERDKVILTNKLTDRNKKHKKISGADPK